MPSSHSLIPGAFISVVLATGAASAGTPSPMNAPLRESNLIFLDGPGIAVGLSPRLGGRVVFLGREPPRFPVDGNPPENMLYTQFPWTGDMEAMLPPVEPGAPDRPFNGHTTWLGPQTAWWTEQDWDPARRDAAPTWPPNPHWERAPYRVIERTPARVVMEGPRSDPVAGWALTKTVEIVGDGTVRLTVEATNASDRPRAWSIWSNTRVHGDTAAFVPLPPFAEAETAYRYWSAEEGFLPFDLSDRWAGFCADTTVPEGRARLSGKLMAPAVRAGVIAAFCGPEARTVLWKASDGIAAAHERAPGHAGVELYHSRRADPASATDHFVELEFHGPYRALAPGASTTFVETWRLLDYPGAPTREARVAFLEAALAAATPSVQ